MDEMKKVCTMIAHSFTGRLKDNSQTAGLDLMLVLSFKKCYYCYFGKLTSCIHVAMHEPGSHDWWNNMKTMCLVSVSDHLPRLNKSHKVFDVNEELPDQYVISVCTTFKVLESFKANKATGPDNIPAWVLRNYANVLAPPLTTIFNNSLREGVLPMEWKMANVIPLPKSSPAVSIEKDIRPISLTPIAGKVFESIIMKCMGG